MLWIKSLHIVFVTSWFAGLFYLPRILVNLAQVPHDGPERDRLLLMAGKLYRFMTPLALLAIVFGAWLLAVYGIGLGTGWMVAKIALVLVLIGYHAWCGKLLNDFRQGTSRRSHVWFRWFNEVPVLLLLAVVILVVVKPF
jgi:protoporphyrinogen IX oxidase